MSNFCSYKNLQIEWLAQKLATELVDRFKRTKVATQDANLNFCYKLTIVLQVRLDFESFKIKS